MHRNVILVGCKDEKGLVHRITGVLFEAGLNIVRNGEFVDGESNRFYMRTDVEGAVDSAGLCRALAEVLPADAWIEMRSPRPKKIAVLATKEYHCLGDLLLRHANGDLNAQICAVLSNHEVLGDLVRTFDLPFHCISHVDMARDEHERLLIEQLGQYELDYVVLAKYMRILSHDFVRAFAHRIINIHHSFLPAFIGANPYRQAFERGVKIIGATAHFVTDDLDEGPIVAQSVLPVDHRQTARDMARAGREVEKIALARALDLVFADRVVVVGNRTIIFD
ncbi:MAG: formyltetrahydrofolate deformylase [Candidatus Latescibacterota bacterium]